MTEGISPLGPIDPASLPPVDDETEKKAPWIVRKLAGSMTGRIVMSSYESLRAAGTTVVCLSPGGMAAVAAPAMGPISDVVLSSLGDSILVEMGLHTGFELSAKATNDLVFGHTANKLIPIHSDLLETTAVKILLITLKYKHTMEDAALGFYRSSLHSDISLFSSIKDYLAVEKGWFSPYLFASARRPIIPRNMKPDIVFCHGPFLSGDYRIGETLLAESATTISLCDAPAATAFSTPSAPSEGAKNNGSTTSTTLPISSSEEKHPDQNHGREFFSHFSSSLSIPSLKSRLHLPGSSPRTPSPEPDPEPMPRLTPLSPPPTPRRMIVQLISLKPHRKIWTSSARPGESVMNYILFNGAPAIVVPVKTGAPLLAWYAGMTLEQMWTLELPEEIESDSSLRGPVPSDVPVTPEAEGDSESRGSVCWEGTTKTFRGVVQVLFEYLDLCVDWDRVKIPNVGDGDGGPDGLSKRGTTTNTSMTTPSATSANTRSTEQHSGSGAKANIVNSRLSAGGDAETLMKKKKIVLRNSLTLLVAAAVRSGSGVRKKEVMKEVDGERSGIAMWRIP